ncbi:helix-turn-helix domain-containing protein [Terriglobus aquaticus]|uniref:Helix-turn-helix domain-containing protein n=1 Tax=Terriglobus aquaticus TaxID=940139 RepID=A0ABW9KIZ4_9BACT|nr:helix-turn-helix domain-containing protein [Terriglobus aquaticus]
MRTVLSSTPRSELLPFVRAYAQRELRLEPDIEQPVVATLEQVLQFEFADPLAIHYADGNLQYPGRITLVGAHTFPRASILFRGSIESFGVFFQPLGLWQLFQIPNRAMSNQAYDGVACLGPGVRSLWEAMAEDGTFLGRVRLVEEYLYSRLSRCEPHTSAMAAAAYIFRHKGVLHIGEVAGRSALSLRQFERRFVEDIGVHPKLFARIVRFQSALDTKLRFPARPWIQIAHRFGYHDHMHMVHDFRSLSGFSPTAVLASIGDGRPSALQASDHLLLG